MKNPLAELDGKYKVVLIGKNTRVLRFDAQDRAYFMDFRDFRNALLGQPKIGDRKLADVWLERAKVYEGVIFAPGDKRSEINNQLNLWHGWGVTAKKGEWDLIEQHIYKVIAKGNEQFAEYLLSWIARMYQRPREPGQTAIALRSEVEGAGKGLFAHVLLRIWGTNGRHISDTKHLVGHFNAHLQNCGLLFADESLWPGDKAGEGTLKRLITEPTLLIEPKGVDAYQIANNLHLLMASNKEWVVPAGKYARRFAVNEVFQRYVGKRDYWEALRHQIDHGGVEAMFYAMLRRDIVEFDVFDIPQTKALTEQKMQTLEPFDDWWQDLLEKGRLPGSEFDKPYRTSTENLLDDYRHFAPRGRPMTTKRLGMLLRKRRCRPFNTGGRRGWDFPKLWEAREAWAKQMGPHLRWDNEVDDWDNT